MTLPNRTYSSPAYRYGFNGKEKDDEVKGFGNSYDFGARIHDPRIGRFFKLDPKENIFPAMSPYVYAANNPIRYVDVNGMWPGDGNLMILISNNYKEGEFGVGKVGDWTVVSARSMEEALALMGQNKLEKSSFDNLYIQTHGAGQGRSYGTFRAGFGEHVSEYNLSDYNSGVETYNQTDLDAFGEILGYIDKNPDIVFGACGSANGDGLQKELEIFVGNKIKGTANVYLSNANVTSYILSKETVTNENGVKNELGDRWIPTFGKKMINKDNFNPYGGFEGGSSLQLIQTEDSGYNLIINKINPDFSDIFNFLKENIKNQSSSSESSSSETSKKKNN